MADKSAIQSHGQNGLRPVTLRERYSATEGSLVNLSEMLRSAQYDVINLCECQ
jgi:hypothetical protein